MINITPSGWALIQYDWKRENLDTKRDTGGACTQRGKAVWGHSKKEAICKPVRETSEDTKPADTLILNF